MSQRGESGFRPGTPELFVVGFALVLRLWLVHHATWWPISDTVDYHGFARSLVEGRGFQQTYEGTTEVYNGMVFRAYRLPGYPVFLAAIYGTLGWDPTWAFLGNVACEVATLWLVIVLGHSVFGRAPALTAAGLFALHVLWTPNLMTESLFTLLFTGLLAAGLGGSNGVRLSIPTALGFGALLAAAVFVRPIAIVAAVPLLHRIHREVKGRRRLVALVALGLPLAAALSLWTLRNVRVLDAPILLSTNFGAHNAADFGVDHARVVTQARDEGLGEAAIDRRLKSEIADAIARDPLAAVRIYGNRVVGLFSLKPAFEVKLLRELAFSGPGGSPGVKVFYRTLYFQYFVTYPLALLGLIGLARRRQLGGLGWSLGAFVAVHALVSQGNIRFAAPLYPILCLLAGVGLVALTKAIRAYRQGT